MRGSWAGRFRIGVATATAALAVSTPVGMAGNCAAGYCLVPVPGAGTHSAAAYGNLDTYWRDRTKIVVINPTLGAVRDTAPLSNAFNWNAFGIGAGVAFGSMLLLTALGVSVVGFRVTRSGNARSVEAA